MRQPKPQNPADKAGSVEESVLFENVRPGGFARPIPHDLASLGAGAEEENTEEKSDAESANG